MEDNDVELKKLMYKIAFKAQWESLQLEEDEFRLLNQTSGEKMAEIAYKYRIPFAQFIHNADQVIGDFNKLKFRQYIRDVRELKSALEAPIKFKDKNQIEIEPISIDPDEREREIMQAAIEEVFEGRFNDEPEVEEIPLIDDFLAKQREKCNEIRTNDSELPKEGEASRLIIDNSSNTENYISLQRQEAFSRLHLTIPEIVNKETNLESDLPEPSLDELAALGLLDGDNGRKMFENIYQKQNEIRRTDEELILPEINSPVVASSFNQEVEIPLDNLNIDSLDDHQRIIPQSEKIQQQQQQQEGAIDSELVSRVISNENNDSVVNTTNQYIERVAIIARVDTETETIGLQQQHSKKRAKRRILNRRENLLVRVCSTTNFNKTLVVKLPKKLPKMRRNPNSVSMFYRNEDLNIFESLENFVEYNLPPDDEEIEDIPENNPVNIADSSEPIMTTIINEGGKAPTSKRRIASPELEKSNKRSKSNPIDIDTTMPPIFNETLATNIETMPPPIFDGTFVATVLPQNTESTQPELDHVQQSIEIPLIDSNLDDHVAREPILLQPKPIPAVETNITHDLSTSKQSDTSKILPPSMHFINQSSIASAFDSFRKAKQLRTIPIPLLKQVTEKDFEYSRLSNISKQIHDAVLPPENSQIPIPPTTNEVIAENSSSLVSEKYREFKKHGIEYVEFCNKHNQLIKLEEYNLENMALYMQVRKYMKNNGIWNANVEEMLNQGIFKLLHSIENKHVIENRLWRLCEEKFFIGTWSNNDLNLLQIQIPVKFREHSSSDSENKENVP